MSEILNLIIDTREQRPWSFPQEYVSTKFRKLDFGDYALEGDTQFSVERKTLADFVGTVVGGWDRFQRELDRADEAGAQMPIIVEGNLTQVSRGQYQSGVSPQLIWKRQAQIIERGFPLLWADSAAVAGATAYTLFRQRRHSLPKEEA